MAVDQEGVGVLIRICRNKAGGWDVLEEDHQHGTFTTREAACEFANRLTAGRAGASAIVLQEGSAGRADSAR